MSKTKPKTTPKAKPKDDFEVKIADREIIFHTADRRYRVRGLEKNASAARLHVNLKVDRLDAMHVDSVDLYSDRSRRQFVKRVGEEVCVPEEAVKQDLARILRKLEELQVERAGGALAEPEPVELSQSERRAALELLKDPKLLDRILADYERLGVVGEETAKTVCYLGCVSRLLKKPLAVLIQSSSAAGKTTLMDAALHFLPPEDQVRFSAMTGQSLFYMGRDDLKHKVLAVAEEEGVLEASYALKLLQSEGRLTLAAAERDGDTGRQRTRHYEVEGPVMMFLTTTAEDPDPELENRCLTLHVNESPEQTAAIHRRQREAFGAERQADGVAVSLLHQNAQRLLQRLPVVIPRAEELSFRTDQTRMRRDHAKYLSLIAASALLHQHQRERLVRPAGDGDETCVVASVRDVELAGRLMAEIAGATLEGLLPQTRRLLALLDDYLNAKATSSKTERTELRFTQREVREAIGLSDRQLRRHLARLVELEYVVAFRTGVGNGREYALLYDGQGRRGESFLLGLVDPAKLSEPSQSKRDGRKKKQTGIEPAARRRATGGPPAAAKNGVKPASQTTC